MQNAHSRLDSFTRQMKWLATPPKIDPTLDRRSAMLSAIRQITERELTDRQRTAVKLCFFEGLSVTDAAKEMGLNKSTVSRHLNAAKARIEQALRYSFFPLWRES